MEAALVFTLLAVIIISLVFAFKQRSYVNHLELQNDTLRSQLSRRPLL